MPKIQISLYFQNQLLKSAKCMGVNNPVLRAKYSNQRRMAPNTTYSYRIPERAHKLCTSVH